MTSERRIAVRRKIFLAAELETDEGRKVIAISRDASEKGLLLLTHVALTPGTTFKLFVVRPGEKEPPLALTGRVVRSEPLELDQADVWTQKIAVELVDPPEELQQTLDRFAEMQGG